MNGILSQRKWSCGISALFSIALGIFLIASPQTTLEWICRILGTALLVTGIVYVIAHFTRRGDTPMSVFQYDLMLGILLSIAGLWLILQPGGAIIVIQYTLGILLIIHAVIDAQGVWTLRSLGMRYWWIGGILSLITLLAGGFILWNPFVLPRLLLVLMGASLIFDGVSDITLIILLHVMNKRGQSASSSEESRIAEEGDGES